MKVRGVVLAGGQSRRMGRDKASLTWQGRTLLERAVELLLPICEDITIISADPAHVHQQAKSLPDPQEGPLGAILHAPDDASLLILPVDMPLLRAATLERLLAEKSHAEAVMYAEAEQRHPFPGLYHPAALKKARGHFEQGGRAMMTWLDQCELAILSPEHPTEFQNFNTPAQWERLKKSV